MKTARFFLSAGLLLAAASTGFGQQPATNNAVRVDANVSSAPAAPAPPVVLGPPREYVGLLTGGAVADHLGEVQGRAAR